jgi:hypothetical protein
MQQLRGVPRRRSARAVAHQTPPLRHKRHRGALAAGDDQTADLGKLLRLAHLRCGCARARCLAQPHDRTRSPTWAVPPPRLAPRPSPGRCSARGRSPAAPAHQQQVARSFCVSGGPWRSWQRASAGDGRKARARTLAAPTRTPRARPQSAAAGLEHVGFEAASSAAQRSRCVPPDADDGERVYRTERLQTRKSRSRCPPGYVWQPVAGPAGRSAG